MDFEESPKLDEPFKAVFERACSGEAIKLPSLASNPLKKEKSAESKNLEENKLTSEQGKDDHSSSGSKKGKSLSLRADVMNKNLFRAFRRELKSLYDTYILEHTLSKSKGKRIFSVNLAKFSSYLLQKTSVNWTTRADFSQEEFMKYLGIFLNMCMMKKTLTQEEDKVKLGCFNDLLYSYSHKKFYDFIAIAEVSTILKIVLEFATKEGFISNQETLSLNSHEYLTHLELILQHI